MSLGAVATALLIPPANLPQVAAIGLLVATRFRRAGLSIAALAVLTTIACSLPVVAKSLLASLERDLPSPPAGAPPPGAIVVLGGDELHFLAVPERAFPGPLSMDRVRTAAVLARGEGLPVLVSGGVLHPSEPSIAALMATALHDDFGIAATWTEQKSADTWENAAFSADLLRPDGIGSVRVVTQAWHMPRALIAFARAGLIAWPAPTAIDAPPRWTADEFVPSPSASLASYYALHEWIGIAYYRLR